MALCHHGDTLADDPVAVATVAKTAAEAEVHQLERVETAISGEIDKLQSSLRTLTSNVYEIMTDLVVASDEYAMLVKQQIEAFQRLRSVKLALRAVCPGFTDTSRTTTPIWHSSVNH
jgi:hypothetical protein